MKDLENDGARITMVKSAEDGRRRQTLLHQLCTWTGERRRYSVLTSFLWFISRPERFTPSRVDRFALVWAGNATVTLDKPVNELKLDDEVLIVNVDIGAFTDRQHQRRGDGDGKRRSYRVGRFNPTPFIVRLITCLHADIVRELRRDWRKDPARYRRAARRSGFADCGYLTRGSSEELLINRMVLGVLADMGNDALVDKLGTWFPKFRQAAVDHGTLTGYLTTLRPATQVEAWGAVAIYGVFNKLMTIDATGEHDEVIDIIEAMTEAIDHPYSTNGLTKGKLQNIVGGDGERVQSMLTETLWHLRDLCDTGVYDAVRSILVGEHLSIDALDMLPRNEKLFMATINASTHIRVFPTDEVDDDELEDNSCLVRSGTALLNMLVIIKQMAVWLRAEREQALRYREEHLAKQFKLLDDDELAADQQRLQARVDELTKLIDERQARANVMQRDLDKAQLQCRKLEQENNQLREFMDALEHADEDEDLEEAVASPPAEQLPEGTILVGGHPRWQKYFKKAYPLVEVVDGTNPGLNDKMFTKRTPLVLINPMHMSHAVFYKLMPVLKRRRIKYRYRTRIAGGEC